MTHQRRLKQPLLYLLVGSILLGAILGIIIVLRNTWGWFESRVILTTIIIATASVAGLACDLSRTPRGSNLLPNAGLCFTFATAILILTGMWGDVNSENFWKPTVCVAVFAVATVHVCLLSIAQLAKKFRWVLFLTMQVIYGLAVLISLVIVFEIDEEEMFRLIAVVSIVDGALTLVIPLLHRISRGGDSTTRVMSTLDARNAVAIDEEIATLEKRISELQKLKLQLTQNPPSPPKKTG